MLVAYEDTTVGLVN